MTENNELPSAVPIIDHVGIAVNSLQTAIPRWTALLGIPPAEEERIESEDVRVAFFGEGPGRIELLEPTGVKSPIARHLESRGEGVHHVCVRVPDLDAAVRHAADAGLEPIPPTIRPGADGSRVAFLHPRSMGGVLLELRESTVPE